MYWGMAMQARGFNPNTIFEPRFDPTAYGLESDRCLPRGIRGSAA
jgi:hypothetical protein